MLGTGKKKTPFFSPTTHKWSEAAKTIGGRRPERSFEGSDKLQLPGCAYPGPSGTMHWHHECRSVLCVYFHEFSARIAQCFRPSAVVNRDNLTE